MTPEKNWGVGVEWGRTFVRHYQSTYGRVEPSAGVS